MGNNFFKMKKQAKMLQEQLQTMQENVEKLEVTKSVGNGLVTVTLSGKKELKNIEINKDCVDKDDVEGLQDLIIAAYNEASKHVDIEQEKLGGTLPDLPFSF